jgi:branched-chain amino acid transport system ATP-binding protein
MPESVLPATSAAASPSAAVPAAGGAPLLDVRGIDAAYGDVQVLFGASLEVKRGEVVALLGSNGAGKTTLIRTVTGLLPARAGTVAFGGVHLERLTAHEVVDHGIACCPEGRQVFPLLSVEENLLLGSYLRRTRARRAQNLERIFTLFPRLLERRRQDAGTLSGGEQQMLAIGRALMSEPQLLILDEPSLGLAPVVVAAVFSTIAAIRDQDITVLIVEQNVRRTLRLADRAYVLEQGRITLSGTGRALLDDAQVKKAYLAL